MASRFIPLPSPFEPRGDPSICPSGGRLPARDEKSRSQVPADAQDARHGSDTAEQPGRARPRPDPEPRKLRPGLY